MVEQINAIITMVGLDVTHKVLMRSEVLTRIAAHQSELNQYVASTFPFYHNFFRRVNKIEGIYVHGSTAITYCLNPSLFKTVRHPVRVETANCISKGKTWPSLGDTDDEEAKWLLPWRHRPSINICVDVKSDEVVNFIAERLMKN